MFAIANIYTSIISIVAYFAFLHNHKQVIQVDIKQEKPQNRSLWYPYTGLSLRAERPIHLHSLFTPIQIAIDELLCASAGAICF